MGEFEAYLKTIEGKDKRLLSTKEKDLIKLMNASFLTIEGKATIPQLIAELGEPVIVKKYAKIEVKTGSTNIPTIVVERFVGAELKFTEQIVVPGIPQKLLLDIPHSGIVIEWIRHPNYKPDDMPKATKAEARAAMRMIQ
jgi:hypothetical protein